MGIKTNAPTSTLTVNGDANISGNIYSGNISSYTSGNTGVIGLIVDGNYGSFMNTSYSNTSWQGPRIGFNRYRGYGALPLAVQAGDYIGWFDFFGYDGSSLSRTAQFLVSADGTPSAGIIPGSFTISTADSAGVSQNRLSCYSTDITATCNNGGSFGIGTYSPLNKLDVKGISRSYGNVAAPQSLSYASTVTINFLQGSDTNITLTGNIAIVFTQITSGSRGEILLTQDSVGNRLLSSISCSGYTVIYRGGISTLSTAANSANLLRYTVKVNQILIDLSYYY